MKKKVGINGFGRMGRLALRAGWTSNKLEFVQINEPAIDAPGSAHLLKYDSVQGTWNRPVHGEANNLTLESKSLGYTQNRKIEETPWGDSGVEIILDCTGKFRDPLLLEPYFASGVKKVVVSAPVKGGNVPNIVLGVNHHLYDARKHNIVTAASCTTNCLAPVVKVMHDSVGIEHGMFTTIHSPTSSQAVVDSPRKDLRRARAAGLSLIPTTTGSAKAIVEIFPDLAGKLDGLAVRVPTLNASLTDFVFEAGRTTDRDEINGLLKSASEGELKGILGYEELPLVSADYCGDARSSIVDAQSTMVVDGTQVKILAWYDNEWGYANRLVELLELVAGAE